eukprot:scaffold118341_cov63-Phaeocystis_antarctica.AAC.5
MAATRLSQCEGLSACRWRSVSIAGADHAGPVGGVEGPLLPAAYLLPPPGAGAPLRCPGRLACAT